MQTISATAETLLRSGALLGLKLSCEGLTGNTILVQEDLTENSFAISRKSSSGDNLEIGNVEASELSFEIKNADHRFDSYKFGGAIVTADIKIGTEYLRVGRFTIDTQPRRNDILKIKALDFMVKFNQHYDGGMPGEVTLSQVLQYCCTRCGITLYTTTFLHDDYLTTIPTDDDELLYRDLVGYVAELAGANAWMDWNGELRLTWYGEAQTITPTISTADRFEYDSDESDIRITGVVYRTDESDLIAGTDVYALVIEDNPLLAADDAATVITAIHNKIGGLVYRPFDFDIVGQPQLWPGDVIKFADANGTIFSTVITDHSYRINDNSRIKAVGESETIRSYAEVAPFTARQKSVLQKTIDLRAGVQITALDQAMIQLNSLAANAQGFYSTTLTDPATGARLDYLHNSPVLAASSVVYKTSADGFFWTDAYTGDDSTTVWTSGYTASGNIVAKTLSVVGINAEWINAGQIAAARVRIGAGTTFDTGYDPSAKLDEADVGDLAFLDLVESAKLGTTIISGGYIRSDLLTADNIITGAIKSSGYSGVTDGSAYSTLGTCINLANGSITSKKFRIDSAGNAYFSGAVSGSIITGGSININNRFSVNTNGDLSCASIGIGSDGIYVEGVATFDDTLVAKAYIEPDRDNTRNLGKSGRRFREVWAANGTIQTSDRDLKTNIQEIEKGVEFVLGLNPVQYQFIDGTSGRVHKGFIAQDIKSLMDALGVDFGGYIDPTVNADPNSPADENDGISYNKKALRYDEFIAPIVQTVQWINNRLTALEGTP